MAADASDKISSATTELRHPHLYYDLVRSFPQGQESSGFHLIAGRQVLLIGPGGGIKKIPYEGGLVPLLYSPQWAELAALFEKSRLDIVDINPVAVQAAEAGYVSSAYTWMNLQRCIQFKDSAQDTFFAAMGERMIQICQGKIHVQLSTDVYQWDCSPGTSPLKEHYDVIVATCSALSYCGASRFKETLQTIVSLLKDGGILYFTKPLGVKLRRTWAELSLEISQATKSVWTLECIDPIEHPNKKMQEAHASIIQEHMDSIGGKGYQLNFRMGATKEGDETAFLQDFDVIGDEARLFMTSSTRLYKLQRHDLLSRLQAYEPKMGEAAERWLCVAKRMKMAAVFQSLSSQMGALQVEALKHTSPQGWTPLHVAVLANNPLAIAFFKAHGVDPKAKAHDGMTAGDYAAIYYPELIF